MENVVGTYAVSPTDEKPSHAVVDRVAELEGTDPVELTPPLYSAIDPEALDSLFSSRSASGGAPPGEISFTYCEYEVCVRSDGAISIAKP